MKHTHLLSLALAASTLAAGFASAQKATPLPPPRVSVFAGVNLAKLAGSESGDDTDSRTGLVAGIGLVTPIAPNFSFAPELAFSMKGGKISDDGVTGTIKLNYLELPVLFRYDIPTTGTVRPYVLAGPSIAVNVGCSLGFHDGGVSASASCDAITDEEDISLNKKSVDLGGVVGAGLAFRHMKHTIGLSVRYNFGFTEVFEDSDTKNRAVQIIASFEFPWKK